MGKDNDASFGYEAIHTLQQRFAIPLPEAGVNWALLQQEWDDVVFYAKQYIILVKDLYRVVNSTPLMLVSGKTFLPWWNLPSLSPCLMAMLKDVSRNLN